MPAKKKQEGITINTEELSIKKANLFQIQVFFKHDPEVGGRGAGKGEGQGEKGKNASKAYEFAKHPLVSYNWLLFWKCICSQWKCSSFVFPEATNLLQQ